MNSTQRTPDPYYLCPDPGCEGHRLITDEEYPAILHCENCDRGYLKTALQPLLDALPEAEVNRPTHKDRNLVKAWQMLDEADQSLRRATSCLRSYGHPAAQITAEANQKILTALDETLPPGVDTYIIEDLREFRFPNGVVIRTSTDAWRPLALSRGSTTWSTTWPSVDLPDE